MVALIWLSAAPPLLAQEAAAVVARYLPPKADHDIVRGNGTAEPISLGALLFPGDVIRVRGSGSAVLAYADGDQDIVEGEAEFTVPERAPLGAMARMFERLRTVLGAQYRQGANLATRSGGACTADSPANEPLQAPVLAETVSLSAGRPDVSLAWVGGCAPYAVTLTGDGGEAFAMAGLQRPMVRIDGSVLLPGRYRFRIVDARQTQLERDVEVVDAAPTGPYLADAATSELAAVAHAAWLAEQDDGRWRLESFQALRPWIRRGGTLAGTFGDQLMWGTTDPAATTTDDG
jgi:hypothetical protein